MAKRTRHGTAQANKRPNTWFWAWLGLLALAGSLALASLVACSPTEPSLEGKPTATGRSGAAVDQGVPVATAPPPTSTPAVAPVGPSPPGQSTSEENVQLTPTAPTPFAPSLQAMIERAKADLARQLGIETSQITVVEAEAVEWPNSGLGCPQPDMMYAQVITPGYRIVLQVEAKMYVYHTDQNQTVILCSKEDGGAEMAEEETVADIPTIPVPTDPTLRRMVTLAREDLAGRLAIEPGQIELLAVEEKTWSDTSLGCPQSGMRYRQVPQDGLLIRLRAEGRVYEYHSGSNRDPFLCEQAIGAPKLKRPTPIDLVPPPGSEDK